MDYNFKKDNDLSGGGSSESITCPNCFDGKSKNKRGRFYDNGKFFKCWNCRAYMDRITYDKKMGIDVFQHAWNIKPSFGSIDNNIVKPIISIVENNILPDSVINEIKYKNDILFDFFISRDLPKETWSNFGYIDNFYRVQKKYNDDEYKEKVFDKRIVIIYKNKQGKIAGLNGRSINKDETSCKYLKFKTKYNYHYIFNLDRVDKSKPVIITEGEIDSMFFDNAIAIGGTNNYNKDILNSITDRIYLLDNDKAGKEINEIILRNTNYKVFSWKLLQKYASIEYLNVKDVNDFVQTYSLSLLINNLDRCVVQGFKGLFDI